MKEEKTHRFHSLKELSFSERGDPEKMMLNPMETFLRVICGTIGEIKAGGPSGTWKITM